MEGTVGTGEVQQGPGGRIIKLATVSNEVFLVITECHYCRWTVTAAAPPSTVADAADIKAATVLLLLLRLL